MEALRERLTSADLYTCKSFLIVCSWFLGTLRYCCDHVHCYYVDQIDFYLCHNIQPIMSDDVQVGPNYDVNISLYKESNVELRMRRPIINFECTVCRLYIKCVLRHSLHDANNDTECTRIRIRSNCFHAVQ